MKISVFSDSHRHMSGMVDAVSLEKPDVIFHLGDHEDDAFALGRRFPDIPLYSVPGNCDLLPQGAPRILIELGGKRIFAAHGHTYYVKSGYDSIVNTAMSAGADILLFGHTHMPLEAELNGLIIINPGAIGPGRTYEIITIENGSVEYERKYI